MREQLIEGGEHRRDVLLGDGADELGFEWVAGDRGRSQDQPGWLRGAQKFLLDGGDHATRDGFGGAVRRRPLAAAPRGTRTRQLLDVERVPAALAVEARAVDRIGLAGDQGLRVLSAERGERQQGADARPRGSLELGEEPRRRLSVRDCQQERPAEPTQQVGQHLDRAGVGPVHVIERQHHWLAPGQPLEHVADRVMQPVALRALTGSARAAAVWPRQGGEDRGKLGQRVLVEGAEHRRFHRRQIVVERVDDQPERDVTFEFGGAALEHQVAPILAPAAQLRQEPRFADSRLARDLDEPRLSGRQLIQCYIEFTQLVVTAN